MWQMSPFTLPVAFLALSTIRAIDCLRSSDTVDHLQILARHGERNPLFPVPELGEFQIGGLTPRGYELEKEFGKRLLLWYPELFAASPTITCISANQSRCVDSAEAIVEGLGFKEYNTEVLYMLDFVDLDVTLIRPFLMEANEILLPACVQEAVSAVIAPTKENSPPSLSALAEGLFKAQIADSIDTLLQSGYTGTVFGVNLGKCIPSGKKLVSEKAFAKLADICASSQCTDVVRKVKDELQEFSVQNLPPRSVTRSVSVYGLSDNHVLDLLKSLLPQFNHTRPQFGGYILLESRGDDVTILTGQDVFSLPEERAVLNVHEVIQLLRRRILTAERTFANGNQSR
ncbi:uncharacterized protein LOC100907333 [Galendromus occidentalis]|uniref:Uncharacterized protein LOC100907333 n=1 Tax=Galendromus occidentalis TaxID=34638 RepID=A0AAJ6W0S0_9ACAR|nr:uncharacterized protein LOC100907333 [Galendromus occidentalis]